MTNMLATIWTKIVKTFAKYDENAKLTEKVFVQRIAVAVVSIVLCLSAMGISAYAYFSTSISSEKNTITASTYQTDIIVRNVRSQEAVAPQITEISKDYMMQADEIYQIEIKAMGNATSGYCKIVIDATTDANDSTSYTVPIIPGNTIRFKIACEEKAKVRIITNWGSYSGEASIAEGKEITLKKPIVQEPAPSQQKEEPDDTQGPMTPSAENSEQQNNQIQEISELHQENQQVGQQ